MVLILWTSSLLLTVITANALIFELPSSLHKRSTRHRDISRKVKRAPNLPATWSYYGCVTDGPQRTLNAKSFDSDSMTVESCVNFCDQYGYVYAGLEYSRECFCDNALRAGATMTTDCNMICSGDGTEDCGAGYKLSTYKSSKSGPTALLSYNGYTYKGCYTDSVGSRSVPVAMGYEGSLTPQKCIDACAAQGYSYAGLEYARECFCGNANAGALADENGCDMPCVGDGAHLCGGGDRLTLYKSGTQGSGDSSWSYVNCYTDSVSQRTLPTPLGISDLTIAKCQAACAAANFFYAGVEYGGECWCGNTILGTATIAANGACNMACKGDASETCGGGDAINIYRHGSSGPSVVPSYGQWTSQGCYVDSVSQRSLPVAMAVSGGSAAMTVELCLDACGGNGYSYGGLEYAGECWCGTSISVPQADDGRCDMPCNGNPATVCGGGNGLSVYKLSSGSTSQTTDQPTQTDSSTETSQTSTSTSESSGSTGQPSSSSDSDSSTSQTSTSTSESSSSTSQTSSDSDSDSSTSQTSTSTSESSSSTSQTSSSSDSDSSTSQTSTTTSESSSSTGQTSSSSDSDSSTSQTQTTPTPTDTTTTTPTSSSTSTSPSSTPTSGSCASKPACVRRYVAVAGDTCASISLAFGLQASQIQTANGSLDCNNIAASTSVCIPSSCSSVYITQSSTTCNNVGILVGVTAQVILASNPTIDCNSINQGTSLTVDKC